MESNNSKIFRFNEKEDYIFYLSEIMTDFIQRKDKLSKYKKEIELIIEDNPNAKFIESSIYESLSDKTYRMYVYLFNLIGDESKKAVSYRKFRKILYKKRNELNISLEQLNEEENKILSDFNSLRNWGLHIPESLYLQKKKFLKMDSNFIMLHQNRIPIPQYENFEIEFLVKLGEEIKDILNCCEIILERIKMDYSSLIGGEFKIEYENNLVKPYIIMRPVENSLKIQKGR